MADAPIGLGPNEAVVELWPGRRADGGEPLEVRLTDRHRLVVTMAGEFLFAAGPPYRAKIETLDDAGGTVLLRLVVPRGGPLELWLDRAAAGRLAEWSAGRRPPPGTGQAPDQVATLDGEDRVRIEFQHHEGPHDDEHRWMPRLVDVRTGEVVFSVWGSRLSGPIELERPGAVRLLLGDSVNALYLEVDIGARVIRVLSDQVVFERTREFVDDALWASPYRVVS